MFPFVLFAQEAKSADTLTIWERFRDFANATQGWTTTQSLLAFAGILIALTILVERGSMALLKRATSRTDTKVDDVFVAGIPTVVRTFCVVLMLRVAAQVFIAAEHQEFVGRALKAVSILVVGVLLARLILHMVDAWAQQRPAVRPLGPGIKLTIKILLIPILLLTILDVFGIPIQAFLTALGIGALAVGLALQDVLKNIFAGIQLVLDQPVRAGDFIHVGTLWRGTVVEIGLRSTKLRTVENNVLIIPNATLATEMITNTDLGDQTYAHSILIGVGYGSDTRRVETVLVEEATATAAETPGFVPGDVQVALAGLGASSIDFRLTVRLTHFNGYAAPVSELQHRILSRLRLEKIEIPFPTRTIEIRRGEPAIQRPDGRA